MNAKTAAVCSLFAAAVLAACSPAEQKTAAGSGASAPAAAAVKKVAITAIADHPALDTIRAGVIDGLKAEGFEEGKNLVIDFQSAQGSTAAATKTVPVVYTAVTDPVGAKLVGSFAPSGTNIVGVSDELPVGPQIGLMKKLVPNLKTIGYVYSPGEVNSVTVLNRLKEKAAAEGLQVAEAPAARSADVLTAARSLAGRADVIFTSLDNNVVAAYESMYKAASESKIPLVASDADSVTRGAVAAMGMDSFGTGQKAGRMTAAILKGAKPGDMPSEKLDRLELYLSKKHAAALGIALPPELLSEAKKIKE